MTNNDQTETKNAKRITHNAQRITPYVIKLGGSEGIDVGRFLAALARFERPYVLVHGANAELDGFMRRMGKEPRLVTSSSGQISRYTDQETMDYFLMTYCGRANKRIVETLRRHGANAAGLSGMDGGIIRGRRKPRIRVMEDGKPKMLEGDFAGSIDEVDTTLVEALLAHGIIPVLTPPAVSHEGDAINVDGDKLAMELAIALRAPKLIIFSNTNGLLRDVADPSSTVARIDLANLDEFEAMAQGRMKKKVLAAADAVQRGVGEVILADANADNPIEAALGGGGTHVARGRTADRSPVAPPATDRECMAGSRRSATRRGPEELAPFSDPAPAGLRAGPATEGGATETDQLTN